MRNISTKLRLRTPLQHMNDVLSDVRQRQTRAVHIVLTFRFTTIINCQLVEQLFVFCNQYNFSLEF